jgi:hypothetical protein
MQRSAIAPVVEFCPINPSRSKGGTSFEVFKDESDNSGVKHPYLAGLRAELMKRHGVYIFGRMFAG